MDHPVAVSAEEGKVREPGCSSGPGLGERHGVVALNKAVA